MWMIRFIYQDGSFRELNNLSQGMSREITLPFQSLKSDYYVFVSPGAKYVEIHIGGYYSGSLTYERAT